MKKRKLFQFFATALALAFVGCSHDALTGDDPEGDQNGPKDAVYMNVTVQLPVAGGMGGRSITNTGTNGDYETSTSGTEIGKDHENVVNTVLLVLAEKGTNKFIACGTQNGFATPSDGKIKTVQSIEKSKLSQYYTNTDNGDGNGTLKSGKEKINVYVFCNPTLRLQTKLKGLSSGAEWIDETGKVIESDKGVFPTTTEQDGGAVWGGSDHKQGFLMATAKSNDIEKEIPKTLSGWDNHNTAEKAFDLTGPNYLGSSSEIDNGKTNNIEVGSIDVERAVARFDFKDGSPLASTSPCTYDVVTYKDNNEDKTLIQIELTKMALVNMSKEFYYLRRVSNDGSDKVPGFPETNTNNFAYCGVETLSNYVVDTDPTFKTGTLEKKGKVYASHFNFCLGDTTLTNMWTINENARGQWYTSEISDVLDGLDDTDDGWNATDKIGYKIWRYVTENTIPTDVANQKHGISTGIVFKGKMVVPDALRGSEKYGELYNTINNAGDVLTGNPNEDPILYAHSGNLYLTWKEVRAVAIDNKESYPAFYNAVFGTVSEEEDKQPKAAAEGAAPVYSTDVNSPDFWWAKWQDAENVDDSGLSEEDKDKDAREEFKRIATSEGVEFTIYQSSKEVDAKGQVIAKGYYCYYYYWNRHNDNNNATTMGAMEFGVVRNNVYKLAVTDISRLGHPRISENDPDPEDPDKPDEEGKIYFKLSIEVLPWVVRVNNIEF